MPSDCLTARRRELQRQSSGFWALFLSELSSQLEKAAERSRRGNP